MGTMVKLFYGTGIMSSQVSCTESDKERFEEFKKPDETQTETFERLLDMAEAFNGELVDHEELADMVADRMGPKLELSMYRVADELADATELQYNENV